MSRDLLKPRSYQSEAIEKIFAAWREGMQRPAAVLPTGAGKTVIFSHLANHFIDAQTGPLDTLKVRPNGGARVVILVHRDELADQTLAKLRVIAPHLDLGKVKAADNEVTADVMVCSVQTLARPNRARQLLDAQTFAGAVGLVIVDECHHAVAESYRNIMAVLGCYDSASGAVAVGFTATMARGDGRGLGDVWEDTVYTRSVLWMISKGYLTDVRAERIDLEDLDLKGVKRSGGDYQTKALGAALEEAGAPDVIAQVITQRAADRRSILVFVPTVALAHEVAEGLEKEGITSGVVSGATPRPERLALYERFRTGVTRVIVNCMVLTEGADFPYADCAVIGRPTDNEVLFIQMVGRVLRPSPVTGKTDARVFLLAGGGGSIRTLIDLEPDLVVQPQDGESLAEAYERQEEIRDTIVKAKTVRFELKHRDLDLFKSSPAYQWLRTAGGVQFIPLGGNGLVALWPCQEQAGLWDVIWVPEGREPWQRLHTCLELGMALAWGESEADDRSSVNTSKSASWRKKPPSEAQLRYAKQCRVQPEEGMRAGEVGDLISIALASRKVDKYMPRS
jgi:ATP-dependent helicase IRC3